MHFFHTGRTGHAWACLSVWPVRHPVNKLQTSETTGDPSRLKQPSQQTTSDNSHLQPLLSRLLTLPSPWPNWHGICVEESGGLLTTQAPHSINACLVPATVKKYPIMVLRFLVQSLLLVSVRCHLSGLLNHHFLLSQWETTNTPPHPQDDDDEEESVLFQHIESLFCPFTATLCTVWSALKTFKLPRHASCW